MRSTPTHTKTGKRIKHGLRSTYANYGCRCLRCIKANAKYMKVWRRENGVGR